MKEWSLVSSTPVGCATDLQLDAWRASELSPALERQLAEHVAGCARCGARKAELERLDAELAEQLPAMPRQRAQRPAKSLGRVWSALGVGLAAAAALLLWLRAPITDGERSKGAPHLGFYVKRGEAVSVGTNGQAVRAGDRLRFVVSSSRPVQLAILGRDGAGKSFVYYPDARRSTSVPAGRDTALHSSVELDGTAGTEQIFGVFCEEPFELAPLLTELERRGRLPERAGCSVDELRLSKEATP